MSVATAPESARHGGPQQRARSAACELAAVAIVLLASAAVLWPLAAPGMSATHDGFLHVQRLIALEAAAREGAPFSRWLPDLAYGYGQPLLLYYAPLSYLPALGLRALGAGYIASFEVGSGLALVLSGLTMYLLARSVVGPVAAMTAAAVYATLPYQLVDLYVRGAIAESWAFVWMPLCALCLVRMAASARHWWGVSLSLSLAGLILTHNVTALLFLPALIALAAILYLTARPRNHRLIASTPVLDHVEHNGVATAHRLPLSRVRERGAGGEGRIRVRHTQRGAALAYLALGVALSAWFWLPAIAERHLVQIDQTIEPDLFASFFLSGWPPFRFEPLYDYAEPVSTAMGYPIFWPQLGLVQAIVSVAGAVGVVRLTGGRRTLGIWAVLLVAGGIVLQLRPLAFVYELVPLLAFVQFPWRLLAVVGVGSALLAGLLVESLVLRVLGTRLPARAGLATLIVVASVVTGVARLNPEATEVDERQLSVETIARAELADYGLGSTHSGEYLPVSSGQRNATRLRKSLLDAGSEGSRAASIPPIGFSIERVDWQPDRTIVELTADGPTTDRLLFHQFAFDGWNSKVDGLTVRTLAAGQLGLAAVNLSPGRHTVELFWSGTRTTMRWRGITVSVLALALLLGFLATQRMAGRRRWCVVGGVLLVGMVVLSERQSWPNLAPASTPPPSLVQWQLVDDGLALADARLDTTRLRTDRLLTTRLVWLVRQTPTAGYRASLEVTGPDGTIHRAPWIYEPLSRLWERGELARTTVAVRLPPSFPTGRAQLLIVFDRPAGLAPIPLGSVEVPVSRHTAGPAPTDDGVTLGDAIRVAPASALPLTAQAGAPLDLALRWDALATAPPTDRELLVVAALQAPDGEIVSEVRRPGDWFAPLPFWQAGDSIEQRLRLILPPTLAPGQYPLTVRIYARDLARGGAAEPGASSAQVRGRPIAELLLGSVTVGP